MGRNYDDIYHTYPWASFTRKNGGWGICIIKIFGATNCERHRRDATLEEGGTGLYAPQEMFLKMKVIVALISVSSHRTCSAHLNMGRE